MSGKPDSASNCSSTGRNAAASPLAMISVTRCLNFAMRSALTASTVGRFIGSITWRVARSMARSILRSRGAMNRIASPLRPARPVRPMRCT